MAGEQREPVVQNLRCSDDGRVATLEAPVEQPVDEAPKRLDLPSERFLCVDSSHTALHSLSGQTSRVALNANSTISATTNAAPQDHSAGDHFADFRFRKYLIPR